MTPTAPAIEPSAPVAALTLDAAGAAELLGVSRSTFWKLYSEGRTPEPLRLSGRVVRWRREELGAWVRAGCPPRDKWTFSTN